jgi:D-3-phosphoglycerate dehydrogenase
MKNIVSIVNSSKQLIDDESLELLMKEAEVLWLQVPVTDEDTLIEGLKDTRVCIVSTAPFTRRVLYSLPYLKGIVCKGVGYEFIDVEAAVERQILVCNAPGTNIESVAEHVFALILSLIRKIPEANEFVKSGRWSSGLHTYDRIVPFFGFELFGKKLGIVGFGNIGRNVARIARGFGMSILVFDPYVDEKKVNDLGARSVNFDILLSESDIVTLNVLLTSETNGLIGEKEFNKMKDSAILINTCRGPVVNQDALIKALKKKKLAGAGIDVWLTQPTPITDPLLKLDNVVLTPHIAWGTKEAVSGSSKEVCEEAIRILQGKTPMHPIPILYKKTTIPK